MDVSKILFKKDLVDIIVMLSIRPAEVRSLQIFHYEPDLLNAPKNSEHAKELLTWIQDTIKFLKQEPYKTIPKKLRDYESKHASRIHSGKKPIFQHLKLLSRITMRQESDHLNAGDNYTIGNTESEKSDSEPETSNSLKPQIQASLLS
ncbi:10653_t:CDS:2 [Cetraspora pellucida]|uniref:10653_t:CDS:1 n=1 Tax=Cetraspora pellucida TaxID=1433469 RepID=A0A9N9FUL3_9GLOM|nr:10653_t:CDS:2 [Cetraspora pellucida]